MNLFKSTKATTYISSRGDKVYPIIMDIKTGIVEGDAVFTTGDIDTAYLYATILEEQSDYNILGSTVICNIQRPDGTTMKVQGDVLGNNLIEFPLGQSGVSQEGIYNFDIAVVFSEKKMVTSPTAQYSVTQSIEVIGEIEEDDRFPVLESLISGINVINEEELVRVSNEEVRQSKEEAREQAESVRARNEETRLANNEAIRNEEAVRVVNENERKNAESLRVQEENKRKQQENTRIAQENTRVSQETARVNAENTRKNQEATRQANEATRVSQETNRSQAESTRNSNETVRQNQENTRKNQEQARVTAEGNRVTSENVRVSAEQARVLKEQERQAIEVERQNSESTREQQEATRVSQENARKQADVLRQQEHESRQQFLDGFEGKLNTVVDDVGGIKDDVVAVKEANKRQDVFLQGLYNENLDGRVTIKEEGSVISLTNSDNGLVDIVGLEGNTLVNYVQDGAKELILNGDIEAEGINVTVTDCVDNGLVDVALEGNTLVNLFDKNVKFTRGKHQNIEGANIYYQKEIPMATNGTFHIIAPIGDKSSNSSDARLMIFKYNKTNNTGTVVRDYTVNSNPGLNLVVSLTREEVLLFNCWSIADDNFNKNYPTMMILEGDWTDKEIPPYFEGMKSSGECEDNKIEIVSQNKNLLNKDKIIIGGISDDGILNLVRDYWRYEEHININPKFNYKLSFNGDYSGRIFFYDKDYKFIQSNLAKEKPKTPSNAKYLNFRYHNIPNLSISDTNIQLEIGDNITSYVEPKLNKKEIALSEPLRALPNGVCDKVVKIGGKWYVERNCGEIVLDGSESWILMNSFPSRIYAMSLKGVNTSIMCDKIIPRNYSYSAENYWAIFHSANYLRIQAPILTSNEFKQWLSENPTTVVYQLEAPIYEELPIDPTLNTYNDITHISNNSAIPCNMKIQNTGYNAIIKPSTQYTVAFDTDKSGTVGINLGGSKVTTNNNVATVTTPSTLVDDSLRLTGKGIKASNIRLLEGDKTNWVPSHFEGMKSSFEDKLQDDGTYKMEILSNNKNLFKVVATSKKVYSSGITVFWNKEEQSFTLNGTTPSDFYMYGEDDVNSVAPYWIDCKKTDKKISVSVQYEGGYNINNNDNEILYLGFANGTYGRLSSSGKFIMAQNGILTSDVKKPWMRVKGGTTFNNFKVRIQFEKSNNVTSYVPHKSNKIQFSSIEPLRGVGNVKDRFVFKDGKLMIERNCGFKKISHTDVWNIYQDSSVNNKIKTISFISDTLPTEIVGDTHKALSNNFIRISHYNLDKEGFFIKEQNSIRISINRRKLSTEDVNGFKQWLQNNPTELVYELLEPTYEEIPFELQKIILEGYESGTLFFDTNIPPTVEASYTANIPVVSKLNKVNETTEINTEDIAITQMAVDFLLMSALGEEILSFKVRSGYNMASYFASRIIKGALKYEDVIKKYPQYKEEIDSILETK